MRKILFASLLVLALAIIPAAAGAQTMADLQALIATLQAQITALTAQLNQQGGSCKAVVAHDISFGDEDTAADKTVTALQKYLVREGYLVLPAGANYGFFGRITAAAVASWQKAHNVIETDASGFATISTKSRALINNCSTPIPVEMIIPIPPSDILGDVNGNGGIDMDDARLATSHQRGETVLSQDAQRRADVTQNRQISSEDVLCITQKFFAYPSCLDPKTGVLGDVDGNGSIDWEDVKLATEHQMGYILLRRDQQERADVTKNGTISSDDALCITNKIFGRPSCLDGNQTFVPSVTVTSPNGGESYDNRDKLAVSWKTNNVSSLQKFDVIRLRSHDTNQEYNLASGVINDGYEVLALPYLLRTGAYTLEIKTYVNNVLVFDASDSYFKIYGSDTPQPAITVTSPNGGENWQKGTTQTIKWQTPVPGCPAGAFCTPPVPKYYDIQLATYYTPCTGTICPAYPYIAPYTIAKNVYGSTFASYDWSVGKVLDTLGIVPIGSYTVRICQTGTNTCDTSDSYFKIYDITTTNQPPVITGLTAPTNLVMRGTSSDTGTWIVQAYDPEGGALSYSINWGDIMIDNGGIGLSSVASQQTSTFTHSYSQAGTYTVKVSVSDDKAQFAQTTATVVVSSIPSLKATLKVTVLNGGIQCFRAPCEFPLNAASVSVYDSNKSFVSNQTTSDTGIATFANLNPGTYTVNISAVNHASESVYPVSLLSGQNKDLKVTLYSQSRTTSLANDNQLAIVLQSLQASLNLLKGAVGY